MQLAPTPKNQSSAPNQNQQVATLPNQSHAQHHQIAAWNYYHEHQRHTGAAAGHPNSNYYNHLPINSPTRRPDSPPPCRTDHQTMVLIPYNTESCAHFSTNEVAGQPFQRHNVLEYQQVRYEQY